jgi:hypothetical protein
MRKSAPTRLLIPSEFSRYLNPYSGYLDPKSPPGRKTFKGLFLSPENQSYLAGVLYRLITNPEYVHWQLEQAHDSFPVDQAARLSAAFASKKTFLEDSIEELIEMAPLPYKEDIVVVNPIQQLHVFNKDFLVKTARNIIQSPEMLIPRYYATNPETGADESGVEYDYNSESYADGTWHPEHLFTNSQRNRDHPYWEPIEVNVYSDNDSTGVGHRYYSKQYSQTQRTRSQFPRWQYSVSDAPYERCIDETLSEGGISDRRVQRNRGYNMSSLVSRSTY